MIGARYGLEILHQCGKRVKTKSRNVLGANSYVCKSYQEKPGRGPFCLNRVKVIYDNSESYNSPLSQINSVSIHQRHLSFLMNKIYKGISQIIPEEKDSFFTNVVHFMENLIWIIFLL